MLFPVSLLVPPENLFVVLLLYSVTAGIQTPWRPYRLRTSFFSLTARAKRTVSGRGEYEDDEDEEEEEEEEDATMCFVFSASFVQSSNNLIHWMKRTPRH